MKGQHPVTYLFLQMDPECVDVNVHPAKREVRFRDPSGVREAVVEAVRRTLESGRGDWQQEFRAPVAPVSGFVDSGPRPPPASASIELGSSIPAPTDSLPSFRAMPEE